MAKKSSGNGNGANLGFEQTLWKAADKLRGSMDPSEYKHVALGLLFLKYISDGFEEHHQVLLKNTSAGADPEDRDEYTAENVFWVPPSARWTYLQANAHQPGIGRIIDDAMEAIEKENPSLKGVLPKDFARPALDKQRLGELIDLLSSVGLGDKENRSKDVLGRVYEYFLGQFANAEGKNGGEFYTPRSVVRVLVEMLQPYRGRVFDPCCGTGGMFVQSEEFIQNHGGRRSDISVYGQESNPTTWRLAKMNLAIRGIENDLGVENADSFHHDLHPDLKADFILANPPFNMSDWGGERLREDKRWMYGAPPVGNANYAWIQHFIHHLAPGGTAGFVLANVSLDSDSISETEIRKKIIDSDLVDCIVSLPGKLFYSNPIAVCLWIVNRDKSNRRDRKHENEILFIDASKKYTEVDRTHNALEDEQIKLIANTYNNWKTPNSNYEDVPGFCKATTTSQIQSESYILFPANYTGIEKPTSIDRNPNFLTIFEKSKNQAANDLIELCRLQEKIQEIPELSATLFSELEVSEYRLGDFLEPSLERLGNDTEPEILTCTEKAGLILQRQRFAKRIATADTSNYKVVNQSDIVYNPYLLWAGAIDQCWIVNLGITSPAYEVFKIKPGFNRSIIGRLLKSEIMIKRYNGISIGTIQRRRRAPVEKFLELKVKLPIIPTNGKIDQITEIIQRCINLSREIQTNIQIQANALLDSHLTKDL